MWGVHAHPLSLEQQHLEQNLQVRACLQYAAEWRRAGTAICILMSHQHHPYRGANYRELTDSPRLAGGLGLAAPQLSVSLLPAILQAYHGGAAPCPRSSCAAAITGDVMLLHGGQTPAGVLHDMHLLNLSTLTFVQVEAPACAAASSVVLCTEVTEVSSWVLSKPPPVRPKMSSVRVF